MDLSPEQKKKMKKAKLSKTLASQKLSKEAILNRMSSGKKRPKSEARIRKEVKERMKTPSKEDLVAKKLFFPEGSDDDDDDYDEEELDMDLHQSPVKSKSKVGSESVLKKSSSTKKLQSSTSKWQVSEGKPSAKKQKVAEDQEKADSKMTGKKNKNKKLTNEEVDDEEDAEIDFPILKRKSLGMGEYKETFSSKKSSQKEQKITKEISENEESKKKLKKKKVEENTENGQSEKEQKKKKEKEILSEEEMSKDSMTKNAEDVKGKKKNKKRGKKRKRSNSESEEPQAKKEKPAREGFAVRCGNLPAGVRKGSLRMFIGEADIFPSRIMLKKKKKSGAGEKKQFVTYATIICSTADEAEKLCNLNGISMPSPVGSKERKLLIHKLNDSSNQDPTLKRKLFVSNLHPKIKEDELMAFFESGNFNPTNVILPKKGNDKTSRGYAFVWVSSAGDADRALKLKNPTLRDQTFSIARSHRHPTNQEP